jgi:hypothetical protein
MNDYVIDDLARAVHARVAEIPMTEEPSRFFGIRVRGDGFVLVPFWAGVAREIPRWLAPPDGCWGVALAGGGWAAPMDDELSGIRPSQHPQRWRMRHTAIVYGPDGTDVSVLECEDQPIQVLRGAVGLIPELMRACWARRREPV